MRHVGHRLDHVHGRRAELAQRPEAPPRPPPAAPRSRATMPSTGWPARRLGDELLGRRRDQRAARADLIRAPRRSGRGSGGATAPAIGAGCISIPPSSVGPIGWSSNSNSVTTPKFPPPPRVPQNRSAFSDSEAVSVAPVRGHDLDRAQAVAGEAQLSLQPARCRCRAPRPPTPVVEFAPAGHRRGRAPGWPRRCRARALRPGLRRVRALGIDLDPGSWSADRRRRRRRRPRRP